MKKFGQILLFIVFGIPGALVFVFSSILLMGKVLDPRADAPNYSSLLLACAAGMAATMIGIGKIKEWMYAFVFIAFPLSFWLWASINPKMMGGTMLFWAFVGMAVFGTLKAVRHYYGGRQNEV